VSHYEALADDRNQHIDRAAVMSRPVPSIREVRTGIDTPIVIKLKRPLQHNQANLLHILGEFPNRLVSYDDLCLRLKSSHMGVKIRACRLRKCLTVDWTIQRENRGYRLIDLRDK